MSEVLEKLNDARQSIYFRHWKATQRRNYMELQAAMDKAFDLITEVQGLLASQAAPKPERKNGDG